MSIHVMSRVWAESSQEGGALLVLLAIADFANDDGVAWPGVPTLARKSRLTDRQVQNVIAHLETEGEISIERGAGPRGTNIYKVGGEKISPGETAARQVVKPTSPGVVKPTSPEPSLEPSEKTEPPEEQTTTSKPPEVVVVDFLPSPDWKTRTWGTNEKDFDLRFLTWVFGKECTATLNDDYPRQTPEWDMTHQFVSDLAFMPMTAQTVINIRAFVKHIQCESADEFIEGVCKIAQLHDARSWLYVQRIAERHLNEHHDPDKSVWRELNGETPDRLDAYRQSYGRYMKAT